MEHALTTSKTRGESTMLFHPNVIWEVGEDLRAFSLRYQRHGEKRPKHPKTSQGTIALLRVKSKIKGPSFDF